MKVLVIAPSWIGDAVAAQPLLMRLHDKHPKLTLDVLAPPWVAPALRRMSQVDKVIGNPFAHGQLDLAGRYRLGRSLRGAGYDQAIVLPNSWKSALLPWFANIAIRTGYTGEARYGLLNQRHALDKAAAPQIVQRYAALADEPGTPPPQSVPAPRLAADAAQQRATLAELHLTDEASPIAFCPGAEFGPAKRWPAPYFAQLAAALRQRGHAVWLIGSAKERAVSEEITQASGGACRDLCGRTSLDQAIDLLAAAHFVVTNDSGLMHVAAALGTPLLALFGSSSPNFTPPLSERARVLWLQLDCSPCFKRQCPLGHFRCMLDMRPEHVLKKMDALSADASLP